MKQFLRASRAFELGDDTDTSGTDSEAFLQDLDFVVGRNEAVLRVTIGSKQLGARKKKKRHHHKIRNVSPEGLRGFEDPSTESDSDEVLDQKDFVKIVQGLTSDSEAEAAANKVVPTELVDETVPVETGSEEDEPGSKATHNCYKNDGKKLKQEELFPEATG